FAAPSWLLQLRFGRERRPSRSYDALRADYRARLAQGGRATGRYVPQPDTTTTEDALVRRTMLLSRWYRVNERLQNGIRTWSENALDRARVPHPLLGRITMRELAFFTVYHDGHHIEAAKRRLPRFNPTA
ncbi:MAG: DinB family protein, partial [Longimicrobiales bacterium]